MPKLELKEMFLWEQSSHHSPKQNDTVLAYVRRLKLSSWASAAAHARSQSAMMSLLTPPVEPFLCMAECAWTSKGGQRHPLGSEMSLAQGHLSGLKREVKVDPVAVLYNCLKKSHRDGRTKFMLWWPQALQQVAVVMDCSMGGWTWGRMMSLGGWCCRRTGTSTGEEISSSCSWPGWMKPHVTCCTGGGSPFPHGRSHWRPSGSKHYFEDSASLSKFLTFCYLISSCLLFTEWLKDKSSVWQ